MRLTTKWFFGVAAATVVGLIVDTQGGDSSTAAVAEAPVAESTVTVTVRPTVTAATPTVTPTVTVEETESSDLPYVDDDAMIGKDGETTSWLWVVDGDTVELIDGRKVRLVGIDAPEMDTCEGKVARDALVALLDGDQITLVMGGDGENLDRYGRMLRYVDVYGSGMDSGLEMIELGLAVARYDSRDGYGAHDREAEYVAADQEWPEWKCDTTPETTGSTTPVVVAGDSDDADKDVDRKRTPKVTAKPKPAPTSKSAPAPAATPKATPKPAPKVTATPTPAPKPEPEPVDCDWEEPIDTVGEQYNKNVDTDGDCMTSDEEIAASWEKYDREHSVYYQNCDAARAAGAAPIYAGEPGYASKLDRNNDGVACE